MVFAPRSDAMELYQLRTFAAVADEGHLTRAAERLHISQPAVSAHIKALEEAFQTRLFERTPSGMVLTPDGRVLLDHAERVLAAARTLQQAAEQLKGEIAGRLRIGTLADPELVRIGELFAKTVRRHPRLELELHQEVSGDALEGVREGRLDASFYFGDEPGPEIASIALRPMVYRVTAPIAWAARVAAADWAGIAALPWIVTPQSSTHNLLVSRLFGEHGIPMPAFHVEADNESVIETLVASGLGISLIREEHAKRAADENRICVWDKAALTTTLWFIHQKARDGDPLIQALLRILKETWAIAEPTPARA
jgi:DNA-binding transcriptional LysR family regulator